MLVKSYWSLWIVFAVTVGAFLLDGAFTMFVAVVYGFIAFGLVFAGMMCVLPEVVAHPAIRQIKLLSPVLATVAAPVETKSYADNSRYTQWQKDRMKEKASLLSKSISKASVGVRSH